MSQYKADKDGLVTITSISGEEMKIDKNRYKKIRKKLATGGVKHMDSYKIKRIRNYLKSKGVRPYTEEDVKQAKIELQIS